MKQIVLCAAFATGVALAVPAIANDVVSVQARARACTIEGDGGDNYQLDGTAGADVICGKGGDDRINGRGGNDIVFAGSGNDAVLGGGGNDRLKGGGGSDYIIGGPGRDKVLGGAGGDECLVTVGGGVDRLDGGTGPDDYRADRSDTVVRAENAVSLCPPFPPGV